MRLIGCCVVAGAVGAAGAQPDYDFTWQTIGSPGNRATLPHEVPDWWNPDDAQWGAVGYRYRMSQTEVTATQWLEFADAYWPYHDGSSFSNNIMGNWLYSQTGDPNDPQYAVYDYAVEFPMDVSWRMAARFCNWLHNGKVNEAWAFEDGAYDTSTFSYNGDHTFQDQATRSPGARFWIPSRDEWVKGMYFDPDKYGPGEEGYYVYPTSSDTAPTPGYPWDGGETNAGLPIPDPLPVGSYPLVESPWGLLDGSGELHEMTEEISPDHTRRIERGAFYSGNPDLDRIDEIGVLLPSAVGPGLRIAGAIPGPSSAVMFMVVSSIAMNRRRR